MKNIVEKLKKYYEKEESCRLSTEELKQLIEFFDEFDDDFFELELHRYAAGLGSTRQPIAVLEEHEDGGVFAVPLVNWNYLPVGVKFYLDPAANSIIPSQT